MNKNQDLQKMGERLRELRLKAGHVSQEKFCFDHDISRVLHSNWENGKGNITYKNLVKVCKALNVTLAEFFAPFNK